MSTDTKPKRVARPVKAKTAPVVVPVVATEAVVATTAEVPVVATEVVVLTTEAVVATTAEVPVEPTAKPVAASKANGVSISTARTRRHIDKLNLNLVLDNMVNELKVSLCKYKNAKNELESGKTTVSAVTEVEGKKKMVETTRDLTEEEKTANQKIVAELEPGHAELELRVTALSKERIRFSNDAAHILAIIVDEWLQEFARHTMVHVLASKKKMMTVKHLHESGVEKLSLYPLIKSLPSFQANELRFAKALAEEKAAAVLSAALIQAKKDFKKEHAIHVPRKKADAGKAEVPKVAVGGKEDVPKVDAVKEEVAKEAPKEETPKAESEDEVEEHEDPSDAKTSFKFYIQALCKEMQRKDVGFKTIRISSEIKSYLSNLVVEFIQRLAPLVSLTAHSMKNKTINGASILRTVESLLIDGHSAVETVELVECEVQDPAAVKAEHLKAAEEKKAGREYKPNLVGLPLIKGFSVNREVSYPNSGFAALNRTVQQKLKLVDLTAPEHVEDHNEEVHSE